MVAKKKTAKKTVEAKKTTAKKTTAKKKTVVAKPVAVKRVIVQRTSGWWNNSLSNSGVLIAVFSALGIASLFCGWLHFSGIYQDNAWNILVNGWDLTLLKGDLRDLLYNNAWQTFIPIITFALSIVAFFTVVLPAFGVRVGKVGKDAFIVILGIAIFILCICFLFGSVEAYSAAGIEGGKFIKYLDVGYFLTIAASVVMILGGLRDATKN